jgi:hypothetical protein
MSWIRYTARKTPVLHVCMCQLIEVGGGGGMLEWEHGLINYIDTKGKCLQPKKLTCKGTLWQVFIRVYRLEIQSVVLVFST